MKLATFDNGLVGRIDGDTVVELDLPSTRAFFERGGTAGETGRTFPLMRRTAAGAHRPEEVLPHGGQLP